MTIEMSEIFMEYEVSNLSLFMSCYYRVFPKSFVKMCEKKYCNFYKFNIHKYSQGKTIKIQ